MNNSKEYSKGFYGITFPKKFQNLKEVLSCIAFIILMGEIIMLGILLLPITN
jgi:hypothetical protein